VKIVEKTNGSVTSTKQFVWCPGDAQPCEERDGSNNVTKRFYPQGEQIGSTNYYSTRNHLGSIRELTDSAGVVKVRYDYDPYGRRTKVNGSLSLDADFGFTGHYYHQPSGLQLALYRAYDADLGRWISRDPIGELGPDGPNPYNYVRNDPTTYVDPHGQFAWIPVILAILAGKAIIDAVAGMSEAAIAAKSLADEAQAYRDTVNRINCHYGGDVPPEIQQALDNWRSEIINHMGSDVATIVQGVPGTSFTGSASDPDRIGLQPPPRK